VAVHRDREVAPDRLAHGPDERGELPRLRVPDGVGDVEGLCACLDGNAERANEELAVGARRILGRELDAIAGLARPAHGRVDAREALVAGKAELALEMDVGGREEHVERRALRRRERPRGGVDVAFDRAG